MAKPFQLTSALATSLASVVTLCSACEFELSPGERDMAADAATPDLAIPDVTTRVGGTIYDSPSNGLVDGGEAPLAGATVCVIVPYDSPCATTDANGHYELDVPAASKAPIQLATTIYAPGHLGKTELVQETPGVLVPSAVWYVDDTLWSDADAQSFATQGAFTYPPEGTAYLVLRVLHQTGGGVTGATAILSPRSGATIYASTAGVLDPTLSNTTSSGEIVFANVTPGTFTITIDDMGNLCMPEAQIGDWPAGTGVNTVTGIVAAQTISSDLTIICP